MNRPGPITARRCGRPSRLSRELIVTTTLDLLNEVGLDAFSVAKLGNRLGASPMSLYTYFPSRDALLDAAAEQAFLLFEAPQQSDHWQDFVLAWLHAITAHFERFPVALKVIAWDEHLSGGWLRVWLPLLRVFAEQAPDAGRLGLVVSWFSHASIGLIQAHITGLKRVGDLPQDALASLAPEDRELLDVVHRPHRPHPRGEMLEFGFRHIITGLETLFASSAGSLAG